MTDHAREKDLSSPAPSGDAQKELRSVFTNEVIRAIGALARQQNVCREQAGQVVFVTGMEAAREYIIEQIASAQAVSAVIADLKAFAETEQESARIGKDRVTYQFYSGYLAALNRLAVLLPPGDR